jgi:hypothetical protein
MRSTCICTQSIRSTFFSYQHFIVGQKYSYVTNNGFVRVFLGESIKDGGTDLLPFGFDYYFIDISKYREKQLNEIL